MTTSPAGFFARSTTLDEPQVAHLIDCFYEKVRSDPLIGPVFNARIADWDAHKALLTSFWCTIVLRAGHYRGNPMGKHLPLPIGVAHFDRWLALWRDTTAKLLGAEDAALMVAYAERIARGMQLGKGLCDRGAGRPLGLPVRPARSA